MGLLQHTLISVYIAGGIGAAGGVFSAIISRIIGASKYCYRPDVQDVTIISTKKSATIGFIAISALTAMATGMGANAMFNSLKYA